MMEADINLALETKLWIWNYLLWSRLDGKLLAGRGINMFSSRNMGMSVISVLSTIKCTTVQSSIHNVHTFT
jgi:hypothetical protein